MRTDGAAIKHNSDETGIGNDNPDNYYLNCAIDGKRDYRITGNRGSVDYLSIESKAGSFVGGGDMTPNDQIMCLAAGGDPQIHYHNSSWRLSPKQVLVIEFTPPQAFQAWNFPAVHTRVLTLAQLQTQAGLAL